MIGDADLRRVAVLASGEGTNLQSLLDHVHGHDGIEIVAVVGSKMNIPALERANEADVESAVFAKADFPTRAERDAAMTVWLQERKIGIVVTAGWMELLTPVFITAFVDRIVNVHPSLLPEFPGIDAIGQAVAAGASRTGVTVHLVDDGVDTGRVLMQESVDLPLAVTKEEAVELLRPIEHRLLPEAVRGLAAGRLA